MSPLRGQLLGLLNSVVILRGGVSSEDFLGLLARLHQHRNRSIIHDLEILLILLGFQLLLVLRLVLGERGELVLEVLELFILGELSLVLGLDA